MSDEIEVADEPSRAKRQKTDDDNVFFREFLKKRTGKAKLQRAYKSLCNGSADLVFRSLEILETNAVLSEGFSRASCKVKMYYESIEDEDEPVPRIYAAGHIFQKGICILGTFLDEDVKPKVPRDFEQKKALKKLLNFLLQDHGSLLKNSKDCDEAQWAVQVAQHLLLPLTADDSYIINDNYDVLKCPCKEDDQIHGISGDTSFGWVDGWHGRCDILVNNVTVDFALPGMDDLEVGSSASNTSLQSSAEIKATSNKDQQQVLAQTIVSSFLQRKDNKGNLNNCLIPGIGISKEKVVIYFYDCEEDVLLGTTQMDLFFDKSVCYETVVFLWLTLNYRLFCTGITNSMRKFKAKFFNKVGEHIENYRNDVCRPVSKKQKRSEEESVWAKSWSWAVDEFPIDVKERIKRNEDFGIKYIDL